MCEDESQGPAENVAIFNFTIKNCIHSFNGTTNCQQSNFIASYFRLIFFFTPKWGTGSANCLRVPRTTTTGIANSLHALYVLQSVESGHLFHCRFPCFTSWKILHEWAKGLNFSNPEFFQDDQSNRKHKEDCKCDVSFARSHDDATYKNPESVMLERRKARLVVALESSIDPRGRRASERGRVMPHPCFFVAKTRLAWH